MNAGDDVTVIVGFVAGDEQRRCNREQEQEQEQEQTQGFQVPAAVARSLTL